MDETSPGLVCRWARSTAQITACAGSFDSLSDEQAMAVLDEVFSIRAEQIPLVR